MPIPTARSFCPRLLLLPMLILSPTALWAQPVARPEAPSFVGDLLAIVIPLVFIIAALLFVLRLARKRFGITGQDAPLSVLQILPVGPRERVVLLRTRSDRVIAIGVCAQSVTFVANLDADDVAPRPTDTHAGDAAMSLGDGGAMRETVPAETILMKTIRKGWPFGAPR